MENRRIKYRLTKTSSAPAITCALSLIAAALVGVVYWPVFVKYFAAPASADLTLTMMTWVYGALIGCYVLFGLCTALLGKKTMILSALFATPVFIYYIIEKCGALFALLGGKSLTAVYAESPDYFSGRNLAYIIAAAAFVLVALISFWSIIFNKGRSRGFAMFLIILAAVARVLFALYDVRANYQPLADAGTLDGTSYIYQILLHAAAVIFFFTLMVLAIELRRHYIDEQPVPAPPVAAPEPVATPAPEPVSESAPPAPVAPDEPGAEAEPVTEPPKPKRTRAKKPPEAVEAPAEAIESVEAEPVAEGDKPKRPRAKKQEAAPAE